jgi:hypothetical protein
MRTLTPTRWKNGAMRRPQRAERSGTSAAACIDARRRRGGAPLNAGCLNAGFPPSVFARNRFQLPKRCGSRLPGFRLGAEAQGRLGRRVR